MTIRAKYRKRYRLIPYGLSSDGKMILPEEAHLGQLYRCPECKIKLTLRTSKLKKPYFSHLSKGKCRLNQSPVALAKHVLHMTLREWLKGKGESIEIQTFCDIRQDLPRNEIYEVKVNHRLQFNNKTHLADLSLLDQYGHPILNIKLHEKSRTRYIKNPKWMELSAEEILDNPNLLSSLNPYTSIPYFLQPTQLQLSLF